MYVYILYVFIYALQLCIRQLIQKRVDSLSDHRLPSLLLSGLYHGNYWNERPLPVISIYQEISVRSIVGAQFIIYIQNQTDQ